MNRAVLEACWPWTLALVASVGVAWLLVRTSGARFDLRRLRRLHTDQGGGVQSLAFVLTFPLFTMILMFIVQMSQLIMANVVVQYAAFAAARSAMVWIPANLGPGYENENCVGQLVPQGQKSNGSVYLVSSASPKCQQVAYAAALACMPIAPSRQTGFAVAADAQPALAAMQTLFGNLDPKSKSNSKINSRLANKLAYSLANTTINMTVWHYDNMGDQQAEPPLGQWPNIVLDGQGRTMIDRTLYERPDQSQGASTTVSDEFKLNEIGWKDPITVTVTHQFALLPGPGRLMAKFAPPAGSGTDPIASKIRLANGVYTYPVSASATLGNEGEKPVVPYVQTQPIVPTIGVTTVPGANTGGNGTTGNSKPI